MRITETRLRQIIREELLREAGPGMVKDVPGAVHREEFLARVEELARENPAAEPAAVVEDAEQDFAEVDGMGRGPSEEELADLEAEGLELAQDLLGDATLEVTIDRTSDAKTEPSSLDQFILHDRERWGGERRTAQRDLESLIKRGAAGLEGVTFLGTETWKSPDGVTSETFMTFEGPMLELERLQGALERGLDRNVSRFLRFKFV